MRNIIYSVAIVVLFGCEEEVCQECVETTTVEIYSPSSSVVRVEEEEVSTVLCDAEEIENADGSFSMQEESFGNLGYYKVTTKITACD